MNRHDPARIQAPPLPRRVFLRLGASAAFGAFALHHLGLRSAGAAQSPLARARSCILLWQNGGPSHIDTFDPKPGRPSGGPFKAIKTRAPGVMLSEHLPLLAERADKVALVGDAPKPVEFVK